MSNEIVKYENRLNSIPLRRFNTREMNLFFSLASRLRDQGTNEIELSFSQLKSLSQYKDHGERFVEDLNRTYHKLLTLNAATDDGHRITAFVLFTKYVIDRDNETVNIAVNPEFKGLFNELSNWTRFSLEQFASLKSTYSKTMFRLLKQYRTIGFREFTMNDFRILLDIPKTYRPSEIDKRALKPIKEELDSMFKGLSIRKIYKGRGGKVVGYRFTWKPEPKNANDFTSGQALSTSTHKRQNQRSEPMPDHSKAKRQITDADRNKLAEQLELLQALGNTSHTK